MTLFKLLQRLLKRNGARLLLAFGSLVVGALTLGTVLGLIGSVQKFFISESQTLLGGDITIESNSEIDTNMMTLKELSSAGVIFSKRIDSLAVVQSGGVVQSERLSSLLVTLKIIDNTYPLFGKLEMKSLDFKTPKENEVFVAEDILERMGVNIGDKLTIGSSQFLIANVITGEPDVVGGSFRLGPLLIMSTKGWERTGIDGKQSRVNHTLSIRFPSTFSDKLAENTSLSIKNEFPRPVYRVSIASDGPTALLRILDAAKRFFFTMIVLALFLVIVNIRLNLIYFLASFQKTIAIMRALGMRRSQLFTLFLSMLALVSTFAGVLGGVLGNVLANTALPLASRFVESPLPDIAFYENVAVVTLFTVMLCLFSALGFLVRALSIKPKMLLLGYGSGHGQFSMLVRELPTLLLTLIGLYAGVYYLTKRPLVALIAVGSISLCFAILFLLARGGISLGHRVRFSFSFPIRSILNFLKHQGVVGTTAIASLTIALASVFSIALIEQNVLGNLGTEFKKDAPNIYLIDIQQDQLPDVRSIVGPTLKDFSVVRARFTYRDGYDIQSNLKTEDGEMGREFNLTGSADLIEGETLIDGVWHGKDGEKEVSIEKDFAERAKLKLGTKIQFAVQGFPIEATVTSIREVTTTSGLPFFFLVFSPDVLQNIPRTSFGYAYIPEQNISQVQNKLAVKYPNISTIPTTQILETVAKVVGVLSAAIIATALPALFLGLLLIIAMLALATRERSNDMLVFTVFGAKLRLLFSLFLFESSAVVLISGIFAGALAHVGIYGLNRFVFKFKTFYFSPEIFYLFIGILFTTLVIAFIFAQRFVSQSPAELLGKGRR